MAQLLSSFSSYTWFNSYQKQASRLKICYLNVYILWPNVNFVREWNTFFLSCEMLYTDIAYSASAAYLGKTWKSQELAFSLCQKEHSALTRVLVDVLYAAIFYTQNILWAHRCCPKTCKIKSNAFLYIKRLIDFEIVYVLEFLNIF